MPRSCESPWRAKPGGNIVQRKCLTISEILKVLPLELEGKDFT